MQKSGGDYSSIFSNCNEPRLKSASFAEKAPLQPEEAPRAAEQTPDIHFRQFSRELSQQRFNPANCPYSHCKVYAVNGVLRCVVSSASA
jgi:hypothetical protein